VRTFLLAVVLTVLSGTAVSQQPGKFGPSSVWQPPQSFLTAAHAACDTKSQGRRYADCYIEQMTKAGAPADAVTFTRAAQEQLHEVAIMTSFQHVGPADIAWVVYPIHQPGDFGLLLVNGQPSLVNAEDLKLLDQKAMQQSFQFQDVKSQFPRVELFSGDRDGQTWPNSQAGPNGGVQFTLGYALRNGCYTCAKAGAALFNWNFDASGKFTGTTFQGLTPAPLPGS
jgi:hypothetical protein